MEKGLEGIKLGYLQEGKERKKEGNEKRKKKNRKQ